MALRSSYKSFYVRLNFVNNFNMLKITNIYDKFASFRNILFLNNILGEDAFI